ncbi:MAG: DUF4339 domain-containing protein [Verrucomicrobiota bacterium]
MSDGESYYLLVENEAHGPFPRAELVQGLMAGEVPPDTLACAGQGEEWVPLSSIIQVAPGMAPSEDVATKTMKVPKPD